MEHRLDSADKALLADLRAVSDSNAVYVALMVDTLGFLQNAGGRPVDDDAAAITLPFEQALFSDADNAGAVSRYLFS